MDRRLFLSALGGSLALGFSPWRASASDGRQPLGFIRTNWGRDPYSYGSYSYVAKGARRRDSRRLEEPIGGKVFFAGEAAHPRYNSTVHAAHESGLRAAKFAIAEGARKIAIVGAGMAGVSAAHRLSREGVDVTIYEARERIGGRIWTDNRLGAPLDLGASWIHGVDDNPLMALADAAGQKRLKTGDAYVIRGRGGRMVRERDAPDWLEDVVTIQHDAGADLSQINVRAYLFDRDYGGEDVKFPGGYAQIFEALKGDYEVRLSSVVERVAIGARVELTVAGARSAAFDAVIVTVPLGVLKKGSIRFDPPLPEEKADAIRRLGMGVLDKVYLLYEEAFWDADADWIATIDNDLPQGQFNQWLNLHRYIGAPVIMAFNGGPPALTLADLPDDDIVQRAVQTLNIAYPQ